MKKIYQLLFITLISAAAYSCTGGGSTKLMKNVTGKAGEMVVVVSDDQWNDTVGATIRYYLAQEQVSLPQPEPLFNLVNVPPQAFADIFKTNRSIIRTHIDANIDSSGVYFQEDVWAHPQSIINIRAKNEEEFLILFNQNANKIISYMLRGEKDRLMTNYANYKATTISDDVQKQFGIDINVPFGFVKATSEKDFYWTRYDTPLITQNVMIYRIPYTTDSIFTSNYLINYRDSLLKAYVQGPLDGSYMATERRVPATFQSLTHQGEYATELRGLWRMEGDFMGGPYVSLAFLSPDHSHVIVADASLYAPKDYKRNYLRQLEAMIYSVKFVDEEDKDGES